MSLSDVSPAQIPPAGPVSGDGKAAPSMGRFRRFLRGTGWGLGAAALLIGAYLIVEQLVGNFHTVIPGELYRSAQINADELEAIQKKYGVRTVINLRGASKAPWHVAEIAESERLGIEHIDYGLSAGKELTPKQVEQLIAIMRDAPKPILVHCKGGADRSGIASALYVAAIAKGSEEAAEWQLSLFYGHFPIPYFPAWAMDETFERIEPMLGYTGS
ncbi:dual specificity protein phosphatase family protein [Ancylobacter mangrovi]|uniref:dual specificity protein phosphatase family protein n=1 Tax=Ancylobacter mangrovi TaxID=2972472 RepID=UPI0021639B76|nr:dual specificity protein phosphatase family protein [Ancylobacter mangrovi]MCS0502097.1 dual specificity protein phosphatase family protein [Ancylobacter mangrovi]